MKKNAPASNASRTINKERIEDWIVMIAAVAYLAFLASEKMEVKGLPISNESRRIDSD